MPLAHSSVFFAKGIFMKSNCLIPVVLLVGLSGCASIVTGGTQSLQVTTPTADGANCSLSNKEGMWQVNSPGAVTVKRSKTNVEVECTKAGYRTGKAVADSGFEPWTLGNLLIGGLIGLGIDWGTGSIHKYPSTIQVPLTPSAGASIQQGGAPTS